MEEAPQPNKRKRKPPAAGDDGGKPGKAPQAPRPGGKKGGEGKQRAKAAGGPKRPAGAYLQFLCDFRRGFLEASRARPDVKVTSREVASAAGAAWRALAPELRQQYEARGAAEKAAYAAAKKQQQEAKRSESQRTDGASPASNQQQQQQPEAPAAPAAKGRGGAKARKAKPAQPAGTAAGADAEAGAPPAGRQAAGAAARRSATPAAQPSQQGQVVPAQGAAAAAKLAAVGSSNKLAGLAVAPGSATPPPPGIRRSLSPIVVPAPGSKQAAPAAAPAPVPPQVQLLLPAAEPPRAQPAQPQPVGAPSVSGASPCAGFSLFIQECRAVCELLYSAAGVPVPYIVLAGAQAWWGLPPAQRAEYAARLAQIQASDTRLGMADLLPQFEQHLVRIAAQAVQPAAPAARLPPGLPLGAGAAGLAALQQLPRGWGSGSSSGASAASLLDQLLASDAGPPPAALSLADAPAALQAVAAHALQLAPVQPRPVAAAGGVLVPAGMPLPPAAMQAAAGVQPARPDSPGLLIWPMGTELSQHLPRLVGSPQQSSLQRLLGFE